MTTPSTAQPDGRSELSPGERGRSVSQAGEPRDRRIESLRALAALGVVVTHSYLVSGGSYAANRLIFSLGLGAFFFFTLSGCLLYLPFARRDFAGGRPVTLSQYATNRALRIFPLYYVALIVVLVFRESGGSLHDWVFFGLLLENFSAGTINTINPPLWTIALELQFYLLLPLLAHGLVRLGRGSPKRALIVLGGLAGASILLRTYVLANPEETTLLRFSLPSTFYFLAIGMILAVLQTQWAGRRPAWLRGPLARSELWLLAAIPCWLLVCWNYRLEPALGIASFLTLGSVVLPLESGRLLRVLDWKLLGVLGLASYSLYIWHVPLLQTLTGEGQGALSTHFLWVLGIGVPLACLVAVASYRVIEVPALRLRKRWGGTAWGGKRS